MRKRRPQARSQVTQEKILQAARDMFAEKGLHGSRIDEIASRAGVNKQRLYAYFGNKEKLFALVLQNCFADLATQETQFVENCTPSPAGLAEALLRHYLAFHEANPHFWRLLAWANLEWDAQTQPLGQVREAALSKLRDLYSRQPQQAAPITFDTFVFVLSALSFFWYSNSRTVSGSIGIDLTDPKVRKKMIADILRLLG